MKSDDIIYGLSEISLYLSNIGREDFAQTIEDTCKIIALLKEQEPVPPNLMQNVNGIWNTCKRCGYILKSAILDMEPEKQKMFFYFPKFCSECGQAVKWE